MHPLLNKLLLKPDLPLAGDDSSRILPWIIAFLVYLAAMLLVVGFSMGTQLSGLGEAQARTVTIQIPSPGGNREALTRAAVEQLQGMRIVSGIRPLPEAEISALLAPWLGEGGLQERMALPVVIEARMESSAEGAAAALHEALASRIPGVTVDSNEAWLAGFVAALFKLRLMLVALAAFIVLVTVAVIVLIARTHLRLYERTIAMLHCIGAQDEYVARQFQNHAFWLGLKGAGAGVVLALPTLFGINHIARELSLPLLPSLAFSWQHVLLLVALLAVTAVIALFGARAAVLRELRKVL